MHTELETVGATLTPKDYFGFFALPTRWWDESVHEGTLFPIPLSYEWSSLKMLATELHATRGVISITPPLWQLPMVINFTIRDMKIPFSTIASNNARLIKPYLEQVGADIIITSSRELPQVENILESCVIKPKVIVVITPDLRPIESSVMQRDYLLIQEVHLLPGVPILYQTTTSSRLDQSESFLRNALFSWDDTENVPLISAPITWKYRFSEVKIPEVSHTSTSHHE